MIDINGSVAWQWGDYEPAVDPNAALHLSINILAARMQDWSDVFAEKTAPTLQTYVQANIESEGGEFGVVWPPLAEATIKDRIRRGYGAGPMLQREGTLFDSFAEGDANHVQEVSAEEMTWGSSVPYSLFLHTGTGEGYGAAVFGQGTLDIFGQQIVKQLGAKLVSMPGRPIIHMTEELENRIMYDFPLALKDAAVRAHFGVDMAGEPIGE